MKPLIRTVIILTCTLFASVLFHACAPDHQFIYRDLRFDVCDTSELPFRLLSDNENVTHGNHVFMARMEVYEVNAITWADGLIGRSYALSYEIGYYALEKINDLVVLSLGVRHYLPDRLLGGRGAFVGLQVSSALYLDNNNDVAPVSRVEYFDAERKIAGESSYTDRLTSVSLELGFSLFRTNKTNHDKTRS